MFARLSSPRVRRSAARSFAVALSLLSLSSLGCSMRQMAVRSLASGLSEGASVFATDDDPQLVGDALPFSLKMLEILLGEDPGNPDLLLALCSGRTQYAYGWAQLPAERLEPVDRAASREQRERARKLYLRALSACFAGLEQRHPGLEEKLRRGELDAIRSLGEDELPWIFWTGASWGAAISISLDRPAILADLPVVRALFARGLELDDTWNGGSFHEASIPLAVVPPTEAARKRALYHYERATELGRGQRAGVPMAYAFAVAVPTQNRELFLELLDEALSVDPDAAPELRLANLLQQERARQWQDRLDELFF